MASEADHISLANRNHAMLLHLLPDVDRFGDWVVTVAFYKAVHIVEAMLANKLGTHSASHNAREIALKQPSFRWVFQNYSHLYTASRNARYLEDGRGHAISTFAAWIDSARIRELIRIRLSGVEHNASAYLSAAAQTSLVRFDRDSVS